MEKYSLKSNRSRGSGTSGAIPAVVFIIIGVAFLVLPYVMTPLYGVWNVVSTSVSLTQELLYPVSGLNGDECLVIGTPPSRQFDTALLRCYNDSSIRDNDPVWYRDPQTNRRYWVGSVDSIAGDGVVVRLFSSYATRPFNVRFDSVPEAFPAYPIGGGVMVVEVPSSVGITERRLVYHFVTGQPLGYVHAIGRNDQTLIEKMYIRLPFSFERLTRLEVGN